MKVLGAFEAKTNLSSILHQVENDHEEYVITRYKKKVARLIPYQEESALSNEYLIEGLKAIRNGLKKEKEGIKTLINEGRKR
jgi:antitoxin (DNA-binding transcriptional repressor) of toxin-antitoxin stability system